MFGRPYFRSRLVDCSWPKRETGSCQCWGFWGIVETWYFCAYWLQNWRIQTLKSNGNNHRFNREFSLLKKTCHKTGEKTQSPPGHWWAKKKTSENPGKKFLGGWQGKKPDFAFPCHLPDKPGKRCFSRSPREKFPAVGSIVLTTVVFRFGNINHHHNDEWQWVDDSWWSAGPVWLWRRQCPLPTYSGMNTTLPHHTRPITNNDDKVWWRRYDDDTQCHPRQGMMTTRGNNDEPTWQCHWHQCVSIYLFIAFLITNFLLGSTMTKNTDHDANDEAQP